MKPEMVWEALRRDEIEDFLENLSEEDRRWAEELAAEITDRYINFINRHYDDYYSIREQVVKQHQGWDRATFIELAYATTDPYMMMLILNGSNSLIEDYAWRQAYPPPDWTPATEGSK